MLCFLLRVSKFFTLYLSSQVVENFIIALPFFAIQELDCIGAVTFKAGYTGKAQRASSFIRAP